jgi:hypothetical protein
LLALGIKINSKTFFLKETDRYLYPVCNISIRNKHHSSKTFYDMTNVSLTYKTAFLILHFTKSKFI